MPRKTLTAAGRFVQNERNLPTVATLWDDGILPIRSISTWQNGIEKQRLPKRRILIISYSFRRGELIGRNKGQPKDQKNLPVRSVLSRRTSYSLNEIS